MSYQSNLSDGLCLPFRIRVPSFLRSGRLRVSGVYVAGALFALGFFFFIDAVAYSRSPLNGSDIHVSFADWLPIICSALGMLIVNMIDKARLDANSSYNAGSGVVWKAQFVLFFGFALIALGLAGSAAVMVIKYAVPGYPFPTLWLGITNLIGNTLIMLSAATLWSVQKLEDDYSYTLSL